MDKLIKKISSITANVPIQIKIFIMIIGVIILISGFNIIQVRQSLTETLSIQLDERVKSIGSDVAARSGDLLLTHNIYLLHELVKETVNNNSDLEYVFILDENNNIVVHTFGNKKISQELLSVNTVSPDDDFNLTKFRTEKGVVRDIAVPIIKGIGGTVRVGLTEASLIQALSEVTSHMLITMFVVMLLAGLVTFALTKVLTLPITRLLKMTEEVSKGNLSLRINNYPNDEIGKLTGAFNKMLANLQKSEEEKSGYYQKISLRNRELSLLNELRGNITSVEQMEQMLEHFLTRLIEELEFNAGILRVKLLDKWQSYGHALSDCTYCEDGLISKDNNCTEQNKNRYQFLIKIKDDVIGKVEICSLQQLDEKSIDILNSLSNQLAVTIENMQLWHELKQKEEVRQKLLDKVIKAQEEERKRIARELHDEASQSLTSILLGLTVLNESKTDQERTTNIQKLRSLIQDTLQEIHAIAWQLRPSILDKFGLIVALERYIEEYRNKNGIDVDLYINGMGSERLQTEIEITVYRIIQEALTNIVKYAKAQNVSVIMEQSGNILSIIIEDDGIGFDVDKLLKKDPSKQNLGLLGMQERASLIGGNFIIESEIGQGTSIYVKIPIAQGV